MGIKKKQLILANFWVVAKKAFELAKKLLELVNFIYEFLRSKMFYFVY